MPQYRKKPVVVEAYQLTGEYIDTIFQKEGKTGVKVDGITFYPYYAEIETLEGVMRADIGDYIITGVKGEKYPCKPDIFEKTYELVKTEKEQLLYDVKVCFAHGIYLHLIATKEVADQIYNKEKEEFQHSKGKILINYDYVCLIQIDECSFYKGTMPWQYQVEVDESLRVYGLYGLQY
jgi:hypothetical protein